MEQTKSKASNGTKPTNGVKQKEAGKTKPKSQAAEDLKELLEDELKDIYWAEKALTKALPKMAKNATADELVEALESHLEETQQHVKRLEQAFEALGKPARAKKCEAMDGLLKEGDEIVEGTEPGPVRDAGIILACQKVEHYEIATYGTLATFARLLQEDEVAGLLEDTLAEEKNADATLTGVAESSINLDAMEAEEEDDDDSNTAVKAKTKSSSKKTSKA
ncbi:MAG: ferritin-like domain-containing protein [Ferruginibacter sp.]